MLNHVEVRHCLLDVCVNCLYCCVNCNSERIGWIPLLMEISENVMKDYSFIYGLSVTEMEIMHAAYRLDNPNGI